MGKANRLAIVFAGFLILGSFVARSMAAGQPAASTPAACPAPPAATSSNASAVCPPSDLRYMELEMFNLVNRDRTDAANLPETRGQSQPLRWSDKLAAIARAHSEDMLARRYFGHVDPDGVSPSMRVTRAGVDWQAQGENIALHYGAEQAETAFMEEPAFEHNHRGNILNPKYTEAGIGIVRGPDGMYYITQEFVGAEAEDRPMVASAKLDRAPSGSTPASTLQSGR